MQFSQAFIIAAAASTELWALTAASPVESRDQHGVDIVTALRHPDIHNQYDWQTSGSGHGKMALVSAGGKTRRDVGSGTTTNGLGINFGGWHDVAQVLGIGAKVKCQEGGVEYGFDSVLQGMATRACGDILASTIPGQAADNTWLIWQAIEGAGINPDKSPTHVNFGLQQQGTPPKLTEELCNGAMSMFFGSGDPQCQGPASSGGVTEGGIVRIGDSKNWLSFLLDPQDDGKGLGE